MKRSLLTLAPALALLLLGGQAHADPITPDTLEWSYNWTVGTIASPQVAVYTDTNPSAGVTFTNEPTRFGHTAATDVVASNLKVVDGSSGNTQETLSSKNGAYTLTLVLGSSDDQGVHS